MSYIPATEGGFQYSSYCKFQSPGVLPPFEGIKSPSQKQSSGFFGFTTRYGKMATKMKKLVCFYCNKKSNERFDGQKQWTCAICEAVNYLDENGEITDPPVAVEEPPKYNGLFTTFPFEGVPISESNPFCTTCLKNQHLLTSSLRQFDIETDYHHPEYRAQERAYYKYKKTLEETYPQVCEDCLPRAKERMEAATKTAKADYLYRMLEKTRIGKSAFTKSYTIGGLIVFLAKLLFYIGILGQLSWNISALLLHLEVNQVEPPYSSYLAVFMAFARPVATLATSQAWARYSLYCSLFSCWWNPKFRECGVGFTKHISGISDWYKFQVPHILSRIFFYFIMGSSLLSDPHANITVGAHFVASLFMLIVATRSNCKVKVDANPLWNSTPEKILYVGPRSSSPSPGNMGGMASVLNEISADSSSSLKQPVPKSDYVQPQAPLYSQQNTQAYNQNPPHSGSSGYQSYNKTTLHSQTYNQNPPYSSSSGYQPYSKTPLHSQNPPYSSGSGYQSHNNTPLYSQTYPTRANDDEMDWTPIIPQKQNIAFKPRLPKPGTFGEEPPKVQASPFYGRLPEAPYSPAHRLRNPPNQARLRVPSKEVKENFFNNITRRGSDSKSTTEKTEDTTKREMNLAQQRFFPPTPLSEVEAGNVLADLLTSFSLSTTETTAAPVVENRSSRTRHFWQAVLLLLGMVFWNNSMNTEHARHVTLTVLAGCFALCIRTLLDNIVFKHPGNSNSVQTLLGNCVGILGSAASLYGLLEIVASGEILENWAVFGTRLTGGMLIYEILAMSFGH